MYEAKAQILDFLVQQKKDFKKLSKKSSKGPRRHDIHRLRVCTRQIRSVLWAFKKVPSELDVNKLDKSLQKLNKRLGDVRELDVAFVDAENYGLNAKEIKKKRKKAYGSLKNFLKPKRRKKVNNKIDNFIDRFKESPLPDLGPAAQKIVDRFNRDGHRQNLDQEGFHKLRIDFKKARYFLESLGKPIGPLKKIQEPLGRAHDLEVLETLSGKKRSITNDRMKYQKNANRLKKSAISFAAKQLKLV